MRTNAFAAELTERKLTVGKIYAGLLIAENWKSYKATGKTGGRTAVPVTRYVITDIRSSSSTSRKCVICLIQNFL